MTWVDSGIVIGHHLDLMEVRVIDPEGLDHLIQTLEARGFEVIGPRVRDGAIVYDRIRGTGDLPGGWTDVQEAGHYRIEKRDDAALFGYAVGPHSWKRYLFPPSEKLWSAERSGAGFSVTDAPADTTRRAFLGVRACELNAIAIQDRVFMDGTFTDAAYAARRKSAFFIAVQCSTPAATCFCASMNTGPDVRTGYDMALTEVLTEGRHYFVVDTGTVEGESVLSAIPSRPAQPGEIEAAHQVVDHTRQHMGRTLEVSGIRELLYENPEHPRWDEVASRCLTCANCTMVCPTCFCSTVEDITDLSGEHAERWRTWDSCFTLDFSYISGGSVRSSARSRYRQWLTHKLATWYDQFGTSGCVGCGRCITWCPTGIDLTEEVRALGREASQKGT